MIPEADNMRIVYMGTPDFAVEPLRALVENGYDVVGVFTQPDKPVGRKGVLTAPPVKVLAEQYGIRVFQPQTLKNGIGAEAVKALSPDAVIVVAYGKILPSDLLSVPKYGCINIHGSVLPAYRGAAPIQRCVLNGEKVTGVTAMQMDEGLDTGDILLCEKTEIGENETSGELFDRLKTIGAGLLIKTLEKLQEGTLEPVKQDDAQSNYAAMLDKSMSHIDWSLPAAKIHDQIRGLDPWPVASAILEGKTLKLFYSRLSGDSNLAAGTVTADKDGLRITCGDGKCVVVTQVQFEGKKRMNAADFLRGHKSAENAVLV